MFLKVDDWVGVSKKLILQYLRNIFTIWNSLILIITNQTDAMTNITNCNTNPPRSGPFRSLLTIQIIWTFSTLIL